MQGFKPTVSVLDMLTMQAACELLQPHRVSLATVVTQVGAIFIQRVSANLAAGAGKAAIGPY
jgi:hypothetical protein